MENPSLPDQNDVASRIARQTLDKRGPDYTGEVRRLIDAGRAVMRRCGTDSRPRVADIVTEAGLSNEGFYRHFASKDALVAAILDDGTERLLSYLAHQMAKEPTAVGKVRCWVEGVLSQAADEEGAATTLAVLWNAASLGQAMTVPHTSTSARLATLLREPFVELHSGDPELDAELVAHAVVGRLNDLLWGRRRPTRAETDRLVGFCLAACATGSGRDGGAVDRRTAGG
ncbi:MAG: TetR/AcrR family transcriptional regulator [Acidimicrobiales bacterium]